ncbi:hypothetical protein [Nonomuraea sp. bgisy101]|uniref:hypothetical protein n=1 Tax=Nonomuraea sp. bgisy101 TaxID=3413784 RepID=UPI003D7628A5
MIVVTGATGNVGTLAILGTPPDAERQVSPAVEPLLGRPPRSFADWAARNVAAFR